MNVGMIVLAGMGGASLMLAMLVGGHGLMRAFVVGYAGGGVAIMVALSALVVSLPGLRGRRLGSASGPAQHHADCPQHR